MTFHPAAQILTWMLLTVTLQLLRPLPLLALGALALAAALACSAAGLRTLLRRTRWIMFSLLLVYGYATPGEALYAPLGTLSPSFEGMEDGLLQLWRLLCALAALSVLLARLDAQQLIEGLYTLAAPLRRLGLSRERLAVRLALTLRYAESALGETAGGWRDNIARLLEPPAPSVLGEIELHTHPFALRDGLLLAAGCASLALAWL